YGDPNYFSLKQLVAAAIGLAVMFVVMKIDYHIYRRPTVVFSLLAVVVSALVLTFFLPETQKTHRWIQFPGFSFQPSELAKIALIFFLAYFLESRKNVVNDLKSTLLPAGVIIGLLAGLIVLQKDLGTA